MFIFTDGVEVVDGEKTVRYLKKYKDLNLKKKQKRSERQLYKKARSYTRRQKQKTCASYVEPTDFDKDVANAETRNEAFESSSGLLTDQGENFPKFFNSIFSLQVLIYFFLLHSRCVYTKETKSFSEFW
jgi:hypothetical protein